MVLDDVTFARLVVEGKLSSVTITVTGGKTLSTGDRVTPRNAHAGLRVVRGPDWSGSEDALDDGGPGGVGTLTRATDSSNDRWYVRWDRTGLEPGFYSCGYSGRYKLALAIENNRFIWAGAGKPRISVKHVSSGVDETFTLEGDPEARVTKLATWLTQNGLAQSGATKDEMKSNDCERTLVFTRADLPF